MLSSAAMASASSSSGGSSKRPRPPSNGCQIASCLVDGCVSDLSKCREYHRRHKVCEAHSKTAIVMVGGREQRFCQQCSRFHLLVEFDEVKRSCRKRLDGHNKRRRKPQPESLISGSFTNHHGSTGHTFASYGQVFPASTPKSTWPALIKNEEDPPLYASRLPLIDGHFPVSSCGSYKEAKRFPFLQEDVEGLSSLPLLKTTAAANSKVAAASSSRSSSSSKLFDSDCALSLLSSSAVHVSGVDLAASSGDRIPVGQPLVPGMHHHHYVGGLGQYSGSQASSFPITAISCSSMEEEQIGNMLASDGTDAVDFNSDGLFHVGLEGSSSRGNSQTLPFIWQ